MPVPKRKRSPWQIENDRVLYQRVRRLDRGLRSQWSRYLRRLIATPGIVVTGLFAALFLFFQFTTGDVDGWRASNAFQTEPRNCAMARALGVDNARHGQPGYALHLDRDREIATALPVNGYRDEQTIRREATRQNE